MPRQAGADGYLALAAQQQVRDLMEQTGTKQAELAKRLGVDDAVIRRALTAGSNPALATIERMATALGARITITAEIER